MDFWRRAKQRVSSPPWSYSADGWGAMTELGKGKGNREAQARTTETLLGRRTRRGNGWTEIRTRQLDGPGQSGDATWGHGWPVTWYPGKSTLSVEWWGSKIWHDCSPTFTHWAILTWNGYRYIYCNLWTHFTEFMIFTSIVFCVRNRVTLCVSHSLTSIRKSSK